MSPHTPASISEALHWRYATKRFDASRRIPGEIWQVLEQALVLSPSSFGMQPWKFIVVDDSDLRAQLQPAAWMQPQVVEASHLVVFCRQLAPDEIDVDRLMQRTVDLRGVSLDSLSAYRDLVSGFLGSRPDGFNLSDWAARQVYLALGFFLFAAASLAIDACPLEGFDPVEVDRILGLEGTGYASTVLATAGYRAADDKYSQLAKVRYSAAELIEHR